MEERDEFKEAVKAMSPKQATMTFVISTTILSIVWSMFDPWMIFMIIIILYVLLLSGWKSAIEFGL